uniref:Large ribosomal subunit protein uL3c n=1 Tax=Tolypiocladia glomerulata TaxID=860646 RepID=A0A1Z1MV57_9FLOR|nr:ribosomal protein L3 [Tolypiocladia glomerulata]ARW69779.1 ribosomal protein L3 [Tolypiocladia glomerulata]
MSINMVGEKIGMTQIFSENGLAIPVTLLKVGPCTVTQIHEHNENKIIQIGYKLVNPNKLTKPMVGHFKKNNLPCFRYLTEYKCKNKKKINIGQIIKIDEIDKHQLINISAVSIGKGFSGYQKRHKFSRGPMSHGSKNHREPGSIGAGTTPGRVFPGKKMAGRMGYKRVNIKNLEIIEINNTNNVLAIKGSVPGKPGNIVYINQQ